MSESTNGGDADDLLAVAHLLARVRLRRLAQEEAARALSVSPGTIDATAQWTAVDECILT